MGTVGAAPRRSVIERRRLLDRLDRRFEVRLTLLIGGAGSGKTTVLSQAMSAEHDHVDVWVPCTAGDRDPARLLRRVGAALGVDGSDTDPATHVREGVVAATPRQVCVVLDDVHLLGRADAVGVLLDTLPTNGHLLVASRTRPALELGRLDAGGQLEEIEQDELLLTPAEVIEFANDRGIDIGLLETAGGWPAFVELAASGSASRSQRYLDEEALGDMSLARRRRLAAFAFVGGGDDEVARSVTGSCIDDLLDGLPLVRWSGDVAQLHDLWSDLLAGELDDVGRRRAANAAAAVARSRREVDRAIDLARLVDDWADVGESLRAAVRDGVDGGLRADQIRRWRAALPLQLRASAIGVLLDGLLERERDPTAPAAAELLTRAAGMFESEGDPALELVALTQLGYLGRIVNDTASVALVSERFGRLAERYPPARPFMAIGAAWAALMRGDARSQLEALMSIDDDDLPGVWRVTRRHLIAIALLNLGRAAEALDVVPDNVDSLPVPIPGALATRSQCLWWSGRPHEALVRPTDGGTELHGARDRFIAAAWEAAMKFTAGDVQGGRAAVAQAREFAGDHPAPIVIGQLAGLDAARAIAEHDESHAGTLVKDIIEVAGLEGGFAAQLFRHHFALPYLLVPEAREYWDGLTLPDRDAAVRGLLSAFVAARERGDTTSLVRVDWPDPGTVAAFVPVTWAVEIALRGVQSGRHEGRHLAAWLCEHWQRSARDELSRWFDDPQLGEAARDLTAHTPTPPSTKVSVRLLGHCDVDVDGLPTAHPDWRRERVRALLVWMVLHPHSGRDQAATALWPDLDAARATKNLRTTLNYLHGVLEPGRSPGAATWFVRADGQRLTLHPSLEIDLIAFNGRVDAATSAEQGGHPTAALPLLLDAIALWNGELAIDLDYEWIDLERIHVRSRFVRAACRAAELLTAVGRPAEAVAPARVALDADSYHAGSYRALAAAYRAIGDTTSARAIVDRGIELGALDPS